MIVIAMINRLIDDSSFRNRASSGEAVLRAEYDECGNMLREDNPENLQQLIRLPGQQWDKETGLYYNRHRYYDPLQGRYITQDPIGLMGDRIFMKMF